jgi:hypothetical protein
MNTPMGWTPAEAEWVRLKWAQIREAQKAADKANGDWKRINDEINDLLDRRGDYDIVQRNKIKGDSIALKDALATGTWHSRNAERHIHDVQLFLSLKDIGIF